MSSFTATQKDGVEAMVYGPNVGGTQINPNLATCLNPFPKKKNLKRIGVRDGIFTRSPR